MQIAVYAAVLVIALGSVLLELDWVSAPMSPMVDTEAGLHAKPAPPLPQQPSVVPGATIGAPIIPPGLAAPTPPPPPPAPAPPPPAAAAGTAPPAGPPIAEPEQPQVPCNVAACAAAYRSFQASDCTYQPIGGPRRLCTK